MIRRPIKPLRDVTTSLSFGIRGLGAGKSLKITLGCGRDAKAPARRSNKVVRLFQAVNLTVSHPYAPPGR